MKQKKHSIASLLACLILVLPLMACTDNLSQLGTAIVAPVTAMPTVADTLPPSVAARPTVPSTSTAVANATPTQDHPTTTAVAPSTTPTQTRPTSTPLATRPTTTPVATRTAKPGIPPLPSPTTTRLAYIEAGSLVVVDVSGKNSKTIFKADGKQTAVGQPNWSPNDKQIAVSIKAEKLSQIVIVGLNDEKLITLSGTSDSEPTWSPDGRTLAFTRQAANGQKEIWLADADGQKERKLTDGLQAAWSPDGNRLAFATNGKLKEGLIQDNAIHIISAKGLNEWEPITSAKIPTDLTSKGYPFGPGTLRLQYPTWLNDGQTLAFSTIGHSGLIVTIDATSGKNLEVWDTQYEGGFGRVEGMARDRWLVAQTLPASGFAGVVAFSTAGEPNLQTPSGIRIGNPNTGVSAFYPTINADGQIAYFKLVGVEPSDETTQTAKGTIVVGQLRNGKLEEKELLKNVNVQSLAWSK